MSGAPVIRDSDGAVAGVVSGRYNSADGWLAGTRCGWPGPRTWLPLLAGIAEVPVMQRPPTATAPVDLLLTVTGERVRLTGPRVDVSAAHGGVRPGLAEAVKRCGGPGPGRGWLSARSARRPDAPGSCRWPGPGGCWASRSCPARSPASSGGRWQRRSGRTSRSGSGWQSRRSWPGCRGRCLPGPDGRGPLALHPLVSLYRKAETAARPGVAGAAADRGGDRRPGCRRRRGPGL